MAAGLAPGLGCPALGPPRGDGGGLGVAGPPRPAPPYLHVLLALAPPLLCCRRDARSLRPPAQLKTCPRPRLLCCCGGTGAVQSGAVPHTGGWRGGRYAAAGRSLVPQEGRGRRWGEGSSLWR